MITFFINEISPKIYFVISLILATTAMNVSLCSSVSFGEKFLISLNANFQIVKSLQEAKKLIERDNQIISEPCSIEDFQENVLNVLIPLGNYENGNVSKQQIIRKKLGDCLNKTFKLNSLISSGRIEFLAELGIFSDSGKKFRC